MDIQITSPDLARLARHMKDAPAIVGQELRRGMREAVLIAEGEVVKRTPVRTGRLRGSIGHSVEGSNERIRGIVASTNVPYARIVEYGHPLLTITRKQGTFVMTGNTKTYVRQARPGRHMFREGAKASQARIDKVFGRALHRVMKRMIGRRG